MPSHISTHVGNAGALDSMQQSSAEAGRLLQQHGATACTDVTGFGLMGHLVEMTRPSQVDYIASCINATETKKSNLRRKVLLL